MNKLLEPKFKNKTPPRILVDRRKAVGDLVMVTPVLHELRRRYPDAHIELLTEEVGLFTNDPTVNQVQTPDNAASMNQQWDLYLNLNDAYELNVENHYVDNYMYRAFGSDHSGIDRTLRLYESAEERETIDDVIKQIDAPYVVMHMRRWAWENKNVSPETWMKLLAALEFKYPDLKFVSVGAQYDHKLEGRPKWINLNEQLSFGEIKHLIANARAFIGSDSGPFHIAGTTKTPIVALLSHVTPQHVLPWRDGVFGKDVWVVESSVPCLGCYARQKPPVRQLNCENSDQWACSRSFDVEKIVKCFDEILQR